MPIDFIFRLLVEGHVGVLSKCFHQGDQAGGPPAGRNQGHWSMADFSYETNLPKCCETHLAHAQCWVLCL